MFAVFFPADGPARSVSFKCEPARFLELTDVPGIVPAPYLARAHWVHVEEARRPDRCRGPRAPHHVACAGVRQAHPPRTHGDHRHGIPMMSDHFDTLETRDPERARARPAGAASRSRSRMPRRARRRSRAHSRASIPRRSSRAPRWRAAGHAQVGPARPAEGSASLRRPGRHAVGRRAARVFQSPGPIYEPEGARPDYWRLARALCRRGIPRRAPGAQLLLVPLHARRLDGRRRRACAGLHRVPRRHGPDRAAGAGDRRPAARTATSARPRSSRSSWRRPTSSGGAAVAHAGAGVGRSVPAEPARCAAGARREWLPGLCDRRRRLVAYETDGARRPGGRRRRAGRDRAPGHRRSGRAGRGRRGRGHHARDRRLPAAALRHRRPVGAAAGRRRPAAAPTCASRAGSDAPTRPPRSRACSCIRRRWRRSSSGIRRSCGRASWSTIPKATTA